MVDIQVLRRVGRRYYRPGDRVLHQPSPAEVTDLLDELCRPDEDPEWWNHGVVGRPDANDGVEFMVAPLTGHVALMWTGTAERSLNPHPFKDAPLLMDNNDNDPPMYWPRSAYLSPVDAKKALAEHIVTGAQPTNVQWQPWGWEVRERPRWLKPHMPEYPAFHLITD